MEIGVITEIVFGSEMVAAPNSWLEILGTTDSTGATEMTVTTDATEMTVTIDINR